MTKPACTVCGHVHLDLFICAAPLVKLTPESASMPIPGWGGACMCTVKQRPGADAPQSRGAC